MFVSLLRQSAGVHLFCALDSHQLPRTRTRHTMLTMSKSNYPAELREGAADLFWQGYNLTEIQGKLDVPYSTLAGWRAREKWDTKPVSVLVDVSISARIKVILRKDSKTDKDFTELSFLMGQQRRYELHRARIDTLMAANGEVKAKDGNKNLSSRGRKKNAEKNSFDEEQIAAIEKLFYERMFPYQKHWYDNRHQRIRNILKSRQIGATYYFAFEALMDAIRTGRNKVFLSASKPQAHIFRDYMKAFAMEVGVELFGADQITLWNGAKLRFVSTNSSTAQGFNGDLYVDEYFWIPKYKKLRKLASGMSSQAHWHTTYFSTPSAITHEAYSWWDGTHFNSKMRPKKQHLHLDVSPAALKVGRLDPDRQWRNVVTIEDAMESGCIIPATGLPMFVIADLKIEYTPEEFSNLFMCIFVDDTASLFKFEKLVALLVDSEAKWKDFDASAARPFGDKPVYMGFDPSLSIDRTSCIIAAPPEPGYDKFRLLERFQWHDIKFLAQSDKIQHLMTRYNVINIGMDTQGIGAGTAEHVRAYFPRLRELKYSQELKAQLVTKGIDIVETARVEVPHDWHDWITAMLQVYIGTTDSGGLTYKARRNETTGHADLAFAFFNLLIFEPMNHANKRRGRIGISKH